jgi:hypothetical protein
MFWPDMSACRACVLVLVAAAAERQCHDEVAMACSSGAVLKDRLHLSTRAHGRRRHGSTARGSGSVQRQMAAGAVGQRWQQSATAACARGIKEGG